MVCGPGSGMPRWRTLKADRRNLHFPELAPVHRLSFRCSAGTGAIPMSAAERLSQAPRCGAREHTPDDDSAATSD
jgi:hypothetical protein